MPKPPARRSSAQEIDSFLQKSRTITEFVAKQPRLLFAMDATASREPTWDSASHVQQEMFLATGKVGSLAVRAAPSPLIPGMGYWGAKVDALEERNTPPHTGAQC